jgi:ATP-dependent DNA helicase RecQ
MVVKSVINKTGLKVYIIQAIDRQIALEDKKKKKNLEISELLTEIEAIVNSGTKLNLDYYINQVLDEDHRDEIYQYFKEAETESIDEALKVLGEDDFSEEDIRLMRVKFISELGN